MPSSKDLEVMLTNHEEINELVEQVQAALINEPMYLALSAVMTILLKLIIDASENKEEAYKLISDMVAPLLVGGIDYEYNLRKAGMN